MNSENTWTQGGEHHTLGSVEGVLWEEQCGVGSWGKITWGEMPDIGDGGIEARNHIAMYVPGAHVPQNLKYNFKKRFFLSGLVRDN